jgi:lipopolysaccharide/colanic/teichoic acid biosynthesis glycosyltransferase
MTLHPHQNKIQWYQANLHKTYESKKKTLLLKKILDKILALTLLTITLPLITLTAIILCLHLKTNPLFTQKRIGKNQKPFTLLKFKTIPDNHKPHIQTKNPLTKIKDEKLHTIPRIIRQYCLDELPQLINIILGQMSLVGPRPLIEEEVKHMNEWQKLRHIGTPGLTGPWQLSERNKITFDEMIHLDLKYLKNQNTQDDIKILLKTIPTLIQQKNKW